VPSGAGLIPSANVGGLFGAWTSKSATTIYQAATDGFVVGYVSGSSNSTVLFTGYTDSSSTPSTARVESTNYTAAGTVYGSFMMPVRKNDYYELTTTDTASIYFLPIGS